MIWTDPETSIIDNDEDHLKDWKLDTRAIAAPKNNGLWFSVTLQDFYVIQKVFTFQGLNKDVYGGGFCHDNAETRKRCLCDPRECGLQVKLGRISGSTCSAAVRSSLSSDQMLVRSSDCSGASGGHKYQSIFLQSSGHNPIAIDEIVVTTSSYLGKNTTIRFLMI